jgi:deoxyribodipyrimidine photo-lyase
MKNSSLLWYRLDLRVHDNEALYEAIRWNNEVIPVYVFDPRLFKGKSRFGNKRVHPQRATFLLDAISALRSTWREMGSDLIVRIGHPEQVIFDLAREFKTSMVFCNRERTRDEVLVQDSLEQNLWTIGQEMRFTRGKMLYYTQDLPFPVTHTPDNFTAFRKELERIIPVRAMLPMPDSISPIMQTFDPGDIPTLSQLGYAENSQKDETIFKGGEQEGIKRMKDYIWAGEGLKKYRNKDNTVSDPLFTSMLSPWLSMGCVSPKAVYHEIKSYESIRGSNESTQSLITELLRRDHCRLIAKKYGNRIFQRGGISQKISETSQEEKYLFKIWKEGRLGIPLIDASMKALSSTGFLPYPLRSACAQFLIHSLKVNWLRGADWYEANLIDYDPASNWVNWMVLAGLLPDGGEEKPVSMNFLNKKYDPQGKYIRAWLPALKNIPDSKIFHPESLSNEEQEVYNFIPGKQYPKPVIAVI